LLLTSTALLLTLSLPGPATLSLDPASTPTTMADVIVSASTGVLGTLLPKLSMLIEEEYNLQKGVKQKISFLKDELTTMQTLLVKLSNNEESLDELAKDRRNKVRELSYDIEDCVDLFMHKMSKGDAEANLVKKTSSKIKKIWSRHKIANLIEELEARVKEESDRCLRYKFDATDFSQVVQIDPRLPGLFEEAHRLVGIDGPREKIIEWLEVNSGQELKVVSIVGFGGLGKTTLANQVYQKIRSQFGCSCFVPVSRNPNILKILSDMRKELIGSSSDPSDDARQLIYKLRAFLQDKRYA
jgi:ATP-dependent Lon protease